MVDKVKDKIVYLYLDNDTMTGYVGETKELDVRDNNHKKYDIKYDPKYPGRSVLMNNTDPVPLTDLLTKKEAWFVEHSLYEKYKEKGYDMLQKPPHPNLWERNKDKINNCKICDELGCNFTKERLEYIMAVHRVSKFCPVCEKIFYFDPIKHQHILIFNEKKYCSHSCASTKRYEDPNERLKTSQSLIGKKKTKEHCENISKGLKGIIFTDEHCKNISEGKKGSPGPRKITEAGAWTIKFFLKYTNYTHLEISYRVANATKAIVDDISCNQSWTKVVV